MAQSVSSKRRRKGPTLGGDLEELAREITRLPALDVPALRQRWAALFGDDPAPNLGRALLTRAIAYRLCRWHAHQTLTPTARRIALRPGRPALGAMHRVQRLDTGAGRSWKARCNRLPTVIPLRSPPYDARASPRPRSRATPDVTFRVDQVLRSWHGPAAHPRMMKIA